MSQKIIILILAFIALFSCNTNTNLNNDPKLEFHIYLNENQCLYCYNDLTLLNELPRDAKLLFCTNESSFGTFKELFSQMNITKKYELSAYEKTITSNFVEIYQNQVKTDSFPIEELPEKINEFNAQNYNLSIQDSISLEGVTLSSRNNINLQDNHLVFCDYLLNTAHIVDLNSKTIQEIKGTDFDTEDFLKLIDYNKDDYEKSLPEMKKQNLDKIKIASVFYSNDTTTIVSTLGIPLVQEENITIKSYFFFGDYTNNKWIKLYCPEQLLTYKKGMYGIFDKVYRYENNFITNLISPTLKAQNPLWAKFESDNEQLSVEILNYMHPKIIVPDQIYPYSSMGVGDNWLYLTYFPVAFNPKTNEILDYSNYLQDTIIEKPVNLNSSKLKIIDLYAQGQNMSVIYRYDREYFQIKFRASTNETLFTKSLIIPKKINASTLKIISEHEFCALAEDRKNIYFLSF